MTATLSGGLFLLFSTTVLAQAPGVEVQSAEHDLSAPLHLLAPGRPVRQSPLPDRITRRHNRPSAQPARADPVRNAPGPLTPPAPAATAATLFEFAGVGQNSANVDGTTFNDDGIAPPDTNGDVGPDHYVSIVNLSFAIFDKSTHQPIYGAVPISTLFGGFSGAQGQCELNNGGDPVVLYDQLADRWVVSQLEYGAGGSPPNFSCVAVSATGDPTGQWYRYAFGPFQAPLLDVDGGFIVPDGGGPANADSLNDYPKMGVWPDGYYVTQNMFAGGVSFNGAKLCAFDRTAMLQGANATMQCFQMAPAYGADGDQFYGDFLPVDLDGTLSPPDGSPGLFINYLTESDGGSLLALWKFHADFVNANNATLNGSHGPGFTPTYVSGVAPFIEDGFAEIPQPDPGNHNDGIDSLGDRMMFRASYRRFTTQGGYESVLANHTVMTSSASTATTGIRWYEIRNPFSDSPAVYQQQTFSPDNRVWRWLAGIAQDSFGNIALGYSASAAANGLPDGGSLHPSVYYTARSVSDPLNTMRAEQVLTTGPASQGHSVRWGDYSDMTVDPVDDCTFWYTNEYLPYADLVGDQSWASVVGAFRFPDCLPVAHYVLTGLSTATTGTPVAVSASVVDTAGATVTGYNGTATFTATDGGVAASQVTIANGVGTAVVTFTQAGSLTLTATDTGNRLLRGSTGVTVTVGPKSYVLNGLPATVETGQTLTVTAEAVDAFGNVATGYDRASARVTSSDVRASLPSTLSFTSGVSQPFPLTFASAGTQTITLTDTKNASPTGSIQVTVLVGAVAKYGFGGLSASTKSGQATTFNIVAQDAYGNTVTGYSGSAQVTTSDAKAVLPSNPSFGSGVATGVSVTFKTNGAQTLTATDSTNPSLTGTTTLIVNSSGCGCGADGTGTGLAGLLSLLAVTRSLHCRRRR